MTITRSTGAEIPDSGGLVAGGGMTGITDRLDGVVRAAAEQLATWYGMDIEIRFNSDRESGGAWLKTADGSNAWVGICAQLITARARANWERYAVECETMAETGICTWGGKARPSQREGARQCAAEWREMLAARPEGQLTICAHVERVACRPELQNQLKALPGWNDMAGRPDLAYHHGEAGSVASARERVLMFAPPQRIAELTRIITGGRAMAEAGPRYIARFTAEAWQRGNAVEIDPLGPQEWDATAFAAEHAGYLSRLDRTAQVRGYSDLDTPEGMLDNDDVFKGDPAAPAWVRDHRGPFTIRVRRVTS